MDRKRLLELAGINNQRQGIKMRDIVEWILDEAEEEAFEEAADSRTAVHGDMILKHVNDLMGELFQQIQTKIQEEYKKNK